MTSDSAHPTYSPRLVLTEVRVCRVERLSPAFVRVHLGGEGLVNLGIDGPWLDQRIKLVFPSAGGQLPSVTPDEFWYSQWLALPEDLRGSMRTYTVREVLGEAAATRLVVDIVVHDPREHSGPGNDWALAAAVGDRLVVVAPRRGHAFGGREFAPAPGAPLLLVADETAVPAVAAILRDVDQNAVGAALLEVPTTDDILQIEAPPGIDVIWLPRDGRPRGTRLRAETRARLDLRPASSDGSDEEVDPNLWEIPGSSPGESVPVAGPTGPSLYAWIAGESKVVTMLRRALVGEADMNRNDVAFMGYWREGVPMRS